MAWLGLEHSRWAYGVDFALYLAAAAALTTVLVMDGAAAPVWRSGLWVAAGLLSWTWLEYALHRFVLHGLQPFRSWHVQHHARPTALIYSPTLLSAALIGGLVYVPAWLVGGTPVATALSLGVVLGNLGYSSIHHTTHHALCHPLVLGNWLLARKRWHALHHRTGQPPGHFGVTTGFWDHLLGTAGPQRPPQRDRPGNQAGHR
jgi:sterol desaturase/sphingolipid hydroxylase (fatty acid hydroxylase superfamily)